jgi:hypothetical protein
MSNDKSVTTATIKFFPNKHIEVGIDGLKNVHPRALDIASNLLRKEYLNRRAKYNADEHKKARKAKADAIANEADAQAKYHKERDEELAKLAEAAGKATAAPKKIVEPVVVESEVSANDDNDAEDSAA